MYTTLLWIFGTALMLGVAAIAAWGLASAAAGREFERLGQAGDVMTALHDEVRGRADELLGLPA